MVPNDGDGQSNVSNDPGRFRLQEESAAPRVLDRPLNPPVGTRHSDGVKVVEWDGKNWREPASGRIA
jgi:hypothetical protein